MNNTTRGGARPNSGPKTGAPVKGQKMFSFRMDNDVVEMLEGVDNKGRYINNLLREALQKGKGN